MTQSRKESVSALAETHKMLLDVLPHHQCVIAAVHPDGTTLTVYAGPLPSDRMEILARQNISSSEEDRRVLRAAIASLSADLRVVEAIIRAQTVKSKPNDP